MLTHLHVSIVVYLKRQNIVGRDLDDEFVYKTDDDDSDLYVSGGVPNLQEESYVRFINSTLLSGP